MGERFPAKPDLSLSAKVLGSAKLVFYDSSAKVVHNPVKSIASKSTGGADARSPRQKLLPPARGRSGALAKCTERSQWETNSSGFLVLDKTTNSIGLCKATSPTS